MARIRSSSEGKTLSRRSDAPARKADPRKAPSSSRETPSRNPVRETRSPTIRNLHQDSFQAQATSTRGLNAASGSGGTGRTPPHVQRANESMERIRSGNLERAANPQPVPFKPGTPDLQYDGMLVGSGGVDASGKPVILMYPPDTAISDVQPFTPRGGVRNDETLIYTNGILTDTAGQASSLQYLADLTGSATVGVRNSTAGFLRDLAQSGVDTLNPEWLNPASVALAETVLAELSQGKPIHLVGHSQGGLVTSNALKIVDSILKGTPQETGFDARTLDTMRQGYQDMKVETFGSAAHDYPAGPHYVHYINVQDPVPSEIGLGGNIPSATVEDFQRRAGGDKATVYFLNSPGNNPHSPLPAHDLEALYLANRVPFAEAQRNAGKIIPSKELGADELMAVGVSERVATELSLRYPLLELDSQHSGLDTLQSIVREYKDFAPPGASVDDFVKQLFQDAARGNPSKPEEGVYTLMRVLGRIADAPPDGDWVGTLEYVRHDYERAGHTHATQAIDRLIEQLEEAGF
ncbi:lipase family protein [Hyalangium gracile]|uniref:alpha/beta hydrolase n=1 Tax=Hyalangium gracile TaxID=394092 RepID=UPI001CC9735C|nr:alpha/beta hydrolase [Hyalangium gracile]